MSLAKIVRIWPRHGRLCFYSNSRYLKSYIPDGIVSEQICEPSHEAESQKSQCVNIRKYSLFYQTTKMAPAARNELLNKENIRDVLASVDTILTDCDGVLWNDKYPIPGAPEAIQRLKQMGKRVFYITNNSTKSRTEYKQRCSEMGFPACEDDIISSGYVTAQYIKHTLNYTGKVYMIGSTGLQQEFDAIGIRHIGTGEDLEDIYDLDKVEKMELDPEVRCVVVGWDKYFSLTKVIKASCYLQQPDCIFIGTNIDSCIPMDGNRIMTGTGPMVKCVAFSSGKEPFMIGKPQKPIFDVAMKMYNLDPERTIMIGDRLNTDIELGHNCGIRTLHVHTGFHKLADVERCMASNSTDDKKLVPHYYLPSLADLLPLVDQLH